MNETHTLGAEHLAAAARDSLTDEMVSRLSAIAADGLDLFDQVHRSGLVQALPAISQLVANGDLDRLVALARAYGAAQDAITDEMVSRMAETLAESLSLVDRLHRAGLGRLVGALERLPSDGVLDQLEGITKRLAAGMEILEGALYALEMAKREMTTTATAEGGVSGLWRLIRTSENQEALRFLLAFGREFRQGRMRATV